MLILWLATLGVAEVTSDYVIIARTPQSCDTSCRLYCVVVDSKHNRWGLPDGGAQLDRNHNAADTYLVESRCKSWTLELCSWDQNESTVWRWVWAEQECWKWGCRKEGSDNYFMSLDNVDHCITASIIPVNSYTPACFRKLTSLVLCTFEPFTPIWRHSWRDPLVSNTTLGMSVCWLFHRFWGWIQLADGSLIPLW